MKDALPGLLIAHTRDVSRLPLSIALLLVSACSVEAPMEVQPPPGGGKADNPNAVCPAGQTCLDFKSYDVAFTNPSCQRYEYAQPVANSRNTGEILAKPKNVFCTKEDSDASGSRPESPQSRLKSWVDSTIAGDEIFLSFLSFSDPIVADALCEAVQRDVKVDFVLDSDSSKAQALRQCGANVERRGHQGSVGFEHIKLVMINPKTATSSDEDPSFLRMAFGSGNLSSGTHLHHENWHFAEVNRESYFVENHLCLMNALLDPTKESTNGKGNFRTALSECREDISFAPEDDLRAFFIPSLEDRSDARGLMQLQMLQAASVDIAAHRFSWRQLMDALKFQLDDEPDFEARLVVDDDVYWLQPLIGAPAVVGFNSENEAEEISALIESGGGPTGNFDDESRFSVKFMETNHRGFLLHHNKFIIFRNAQGQATGVLYGAANFTGTGFDSNLENVYFTTIPSIVHAFDQQFARFWGDSELTTEDPEPPRATAAQDMPADDLAPLFN